MKTPLDIKESGFLGRLTVALVSSDDIQLISDLLEQHPEIINVVNYNECTLLHYAIRMEADIENIRLLLEYGADPLIKSKGFFLQALSLH